MHEASSSFYSPPTSPRTFDSVHPRELLPLREPPETLLLYPPVLPSEAVKRSKKTCPISEEFSLSTHLVPAAYPRTTPFLPLPERFASSYTTSKEERKARAQEVTEYILSVKKRQSNGEITPDERENRLLWNCVNRYARKDRTPKSKKSITLLLTHANGFPREIWEPFLRYLLAQSSENDAVSIDEVWAFEAVQHGDSFIINQDKLGVVYDWSDNTRDILSFLTRYLPSERTTAPLPSHLSRLSDKTSNDRIANGFADRTLVVIGHSFGGCTAALAALTAPRLFSRLLLVDPVIVPPYIDRTNGIYNFVIGAAQRRGEWKDRNETHRLFSASPFFSAWDPAVLDIYVECGLTPLKHDSADLEDGGVALKMPGIQEGVVFAEALLTHEVFERLKDLDPHIALRWVIPGKGGFVSGSEDAALDLVWRRPANASNVRIASSGHLIPQESPRELALEARLFLEGAADRVERAKL
ncbi:Alpha/beta hydrolase family-domain-containing protein [Phellopilus nigrolimitatus]|nr:Alpha/beta hydrolase family-domain-containing protein [Phellopilus nigrolimitatus]